MPSRATVSPVWPGLGELSGADFRTGAAGKRLATALAEEQTLTYRTLIEIANVLVRQVAVFGHEI